MAFSMETLVGPDRHWSRKVAKHRQGSEKPSSRQLDLRLTCQLADITDCTSGLSILYLWVKPLEANARIGGGELPVN